MAVNDALTTLGGLEVTNAPKAAPTMMMNSLGCHSSISLPPSMTKLPQTQSRTITEPMIVNTRASHR